MLFLTLVMTLTASVMPAQLTNEIPVSEPQYGPAPSDQSSPVVASNGVDFLVAWSDARGATATIYANRVTGDGTVLDGTGIRIPLEPGTSNGRLVGLFRLDGSYTLIYSSQDFQARRFRTLSAVINDGGQLIDGPRVILDDAAAHAAATNGARIVMFAGGDIRRAQRPWRHRRSLSISECSALRIRSRLERIDLPVWHLLV